MPLSPDYVEYAVELLAGSGPIEVKRMFGGAGLYRNGVMFAILDDDAIFVRVNAALATDLKAQGSAPWSYSMKSDGSVREMGYWRLPETAVDDSDEAAEIARRAYAAALERQSARARSKPKKTASRKAAPAKKTAAKKKAASASPARTARTTPRSKK